MKTVALPPLFWLGLALFAVLWRLVPVLNPQWAWALANLSPVVALALVAGWRGQWRGLGVLLPLAVVVASDASIHFITGWAYFYPSLPFVYGSYALVGLLGLLLRGQTHPLFVLAGALGSSVLFFTLSNFGVWVGGEGYAPTWQGLVLCYEMAVPFFKKSLVGDLVFTATFTGLAWWSQTRRAKATATA